MAIKLPTVTGMFDPETVTVHIPTEIEDRIGQRIYNQWRQESVDNVLVWPGDTTSDPEVGRPNEITIVYTLAFPKTYTQDLTNCHITVRGTSYKVVGSPQALTSENVPGEWDRTVQVKRING